MDSISNLLISLKNGGMVGKETVEVPFSNLKARIAETLFKSGYVASYEKKSRKKGEALVVGIKYIGTEPRISDVKRISKPSRRLYVGVHDIRPVKQGHGILVLSTPKGILTNEEARKSHVGGEALFEIW